MIDFLSDHTWVVWLIAAVVLAIAELASLDLVLLMFALAAFVAAGLAALGLPIWASLVVFVAVSVGLLGFIRPRFMRKLHSGPTLSVGHHNLVGHDAVVDETVTRDAGRVTIGGQLWTARPVDVTAAYAPGTRLTVVAIDGATARVAGKDASCSPPL